MLACVCLQKQHPGLVIMVECGYKYRFFGRGAVLAAQSLGIWTIKDHAMMTASVPTFRLGAHVRRLVAAGFAVGVIRQAETAALKRASVSKSKLFVRRLQAVYTAGTLVPDALLSTASEPSALAPSGAAAALESDVVDSELRLPAKRPLLAAVFDLGEGDRASLPAKRASLSGLGSANRPVTIGVACVDLETGDTAWDSLEDGASRSALLERLELLQPTEILLRRHEHSGEANSQDDVEPGRTAAAVGAWSRNFTSGGAGTLTREEEVAGPGIQLTGLLGAAEGPVSGVVVTSGEELVTASESGVVVADDDDTDDRSAALGVPMTKTAPGRRSLRSHVVVLPAWLSSEAECVHAVQRLMAATVKPNGEGEDEAGSTTPKRGRTDDAPRAASSPDGHRRSVCVPQSDGETGNGGPLSLPRAARAALGLCLCYLESFPQDLCRGLRGGGLRLRRARRCGTMTLPGTTLVDLELLRNRSTGQDKGSLLWVLDSTRTAMGRRTLRSWIAQPLLGAGLIRRRLDAVQSIAEGRVSPQLARLLACLGAVPDLEAVVGRVASGRCDCATLVSALCACRDIAAAAAGIDTGAGTPVAAKSPFVAASGTPTPPSPAADVPTPGAAHSDSAPMTVPVVPEADPQLIQELFSRQLLSRAATTVHEALQLLAAQAGGTGTDPPSTAAASATSSVAKAQAAAAAAFHGSRGARFAAAALRKSLKSVSLSQSLSVEAATVLFPAVSEARGQVAEALAALQSDLVEARSVLDKPALEFRSLRTGVSTSVEFLIEITKRDAARTRVPADWVTVSTTSQFARYHSPAVLEHMEALARARESLDLRSAEAWDMLLERLATSAGPALRELAGAVAALDALASLARVAARPGYSRPIVLEASSAPAGVWAVGARHPVAELAGQRYAHPSVAHSAPRIGASSTSAITQAAAAGSVAQSGVYVPNPVALGDRPTAAQLAASTESGEAAHTIDRAIAAAYGKSGGALRCAVLTGPNMNGKSSYARSGALLAIMAQLGSYVPADACVVGPCDGVYTRMGSSDDIEGGMSTFMVEMSQSAAILSAATRRSLVIMDELGRGTATHDGTALAQATLEHTARRLQCPAVFITHFPELISAAEALAREGQPVGNLHMTFLEQGGNSSIVDAVVFLFRVKSGPASRSYGLNVARMAGMPADLVSLAHVLSSSMYKRVLGNN